MNPEIRAFLESKTYQIERAVYSSDGGSSWLFKTGEGSWRYSPLHEDGWFAGGASETEALQKALNHWLAGELGRHWTQLWRIKRVRDTFQRIMDVDYQGIEKAVFWHEALEKELQDANS